MPSVGNAERVVVGALPNELGRNTNFGGRKSIIDSQFIVGPLLLVFPLLQVFQALRRATCNHVQDKRAGLFRVSLLLHTPDMPKIASYLTKTIVI